MPVRVPSVSESEVTDFLLVELVLSSSMGALASLVELGPCGQLFIFQLKSEVILILDHQPTGTKM